VRIWKGRSKQPGRAPRRPPARRRPVDWRRYSRHVGRSRRRLPRFEHPLPVSLAASAVFALAGLTLLQLVGVGIGAGVRDLGSAVASAIPKTSEEPLVLGETPVTISAAPILDGVPEFTKANEIRISGKVPGFAVTPQRKVAIAVDGALITTLAIGADGSFGGVQLTLRDGASTVVATLIEGATDIASNAYTVIVKRTPPPLEVTRPQPGDKVAGPDVVVEGKTEPGAEVTVNDRALRPNPDGTFTERLTPLPGELALTVIARDKAGNETKRELKVTVEDGAGTPAVGTALLVALDRTSVRPGETVVARILATRDGQPLGDLVITLQVGVFTVGTYKTDATGVAIVGFAAPNHEAEEVAVVALGGGTAGRATLTVANPKPSPTPTPRP